MPQGIRDIFLPGVHTSSGPRTLPSSGYCGLFLWV